ncbi:MAG: alpha/beta hydrolase [Clostridia bacterium]|nr:alpha/beta hydrolase [Clostridia bacterium]
MTTFLENIPYKYCGSVAVLCDLWLPEMKPEGGRPLVIFFHAGGWVYGEKAFTSLTVRWREALFRRGVAFASAGYRHRAYGGGMPTPPADAADAVRYFRKNAEMYGINPEKIMLCGHSAGGHLALLVGLTQDKFRDHWSDGETECRVCAAFAVSGPANLNFSAYDRPKFNPEMDNCVQGLLGEKWQDPEARAEAEPESYVRRGSAAHIPVLCIQAVEDEVVPPGMAEDFARAGAEMGYDIRKLLLPEGDHGLHIPGSRGEPAPSAFVADRAIVDFATEVLGL